ncbi:CocE/NonD family hydrolase C-terminal non-catalytic domain-containing protein [Streptomyces omiyaensis]|uniref:CocE/NonD family hydrolase C-terminal non-catalytic domain-containing protein n=1 Tax=Streptomyces omiyaensis TaxID=68247 RepID=A0ABW7BN04_9ACTN|nr:CocE/NonD family hydrolase C-terminal non-catalytic domain-containing protein [Streptomyces omiyaensis]
MPQSFPTTDGPSEAFPGFPGLGAVLTEADAARVAAEGLWAPGGTVHPEAVRFGQTVVTALLADGTPPEGSLPAALAERIARVRGLALPGYHRVETTDGLRLSAFSLRQLGPGPHPLVVVPAGWTPYGWALLPGACLALALRGYHVLAYTPRGLGLPGLPTTSEGRVDVAGPYDVADGSTLVDFGIEHFAPAVTGFLGASYGSGIGRLVAAHDERVAAVAALSTWGNLATSLYAHRTRHLAAVKALIGLTGGPVEERFDEENRRILDDLLNDRNLDAVVRWAERRSPETYTDLTDDHATPTFCSHTWHESLFAVNQTVAAFDRLRVPKRLNLWIGDHGAPEGAGLLGASPGGPDPVLDEAYAWLDHHLKGERNGVGEWDEVCAQVMFTYVTGPAPDPAARRIVVPAVRESRPTWQDVTTGHEVLGLTGDGAGGADGRLVPAEPAEGTTGWRRTFLAGVDTEATAMDEPLRTGQAEWKGSPKVYDTRKIDRRHALAWATEPLSAPGGGPVGRRIRGVPRLRLTVRSTAASTGLVAHLFDVAEDGTAHLVTHEPLNVHDLAPGRDTTVTWCLQAAAYDVPAGHRLMLVVDSKDPLYGDASVTWTRTALGSPPEAASYLELPLG